MTAQVNVMGVSNLQCSGIRHASVDGRVLNARGETLGGVRVALAPVAGPDGLATVETRTDSKGRFSFADVSAQDEISGIVDPAAEWAPASFDLEPSSGGIFHLGEIRLRANTTLQVALGTVSGTPGARPEAAEVYLTPHGVYPHDVVKTFDNGIFSFDHLPYRQADLTVEFGQKRSYTTEVRIEPGQRDRFLVVRPAGRDANESGTLEILEMLRPPDAAPPPSCEGAVLGPDGSAVPGAVVFAPDRLAATVTGAGGRYRLSKPCGAIAGAGISLVAANARVPLDLDSSAGARELRIADAVSVEFAAEHAPAVPAERLRVKWWQPGLGWQTVSGLQTWSLTQRPEETTDGEEPYAWVVADLAEYFPVAGRVLLPRAPNDLTQPVVHHFQFDRAPQRALEVRALGKALAGAAVDVWRIDMPDGFPRAPLATYVTGANGKLTLAGAPDGIYAAFIYAAGYAPARALWEPGAPLMVALAPANAVLEVGEAVRGQQVRVLDAKDGNVVARVEVTETPPVVKLARGNYEIHVLDDSRRPVSASRVAVALPHTRASVVPRPKTEIRVELEASGAERGVSVSPVRTRGGFAGPPMFRDSAPQFAPVAAGERAATVAVATGGLYRVSVYRPGSVELSRTVEVAGGQHVVLREPALAAVLRGEAPGAVSAGVRTTAALWLRSADAGAWNIVVPQVDVAADGTFRVADLPAGRYHGWIHVFAFSDSAAANGAPYPADVCGTHAWGGVPLVLAAGRETAFPNAAVAPAFTLKLHVTTAGGKPVQSAYVFADDPLAGTWAEGGHALATQPPFAHVVGGAAELGGVRGGTLEMELLTASGRVYSVAADVVPGHTVEIRLPGEAP
jgi:hypothetical protein